MREPDFTFIDLFAGIGGFRLALDELGGECLFTSEIDARAQETYRNNFGGNVHGDIRDITAPHKPDSVINTMIPDHDILAAGFPCQPFSLAGVSARNFLGREHGLLDQAQGTLFYDIARIARVKKPRVLLLENVSNIVGHDGGKTFATIKGIVEDELGYRFYHRILNAETLVPQRRKRCFMVAFLDEITAFDFPELNGEPIPLRRALEARVDDRYTLSDKGWAGHQRRTKANLERGTGFTAFEADLDRPSNTIVARYYKDGKECLVPQKGKNPRMLTPRECARLQGFPETFKPHPVHSAAYKQFGNSVPVPLVKLVADRILHTLEAFDHGGPDIEKSPLGEYGGGEGKKYKAGIGRQAISS